MRHEQLLKNRWLVTDREEEGIREAVKLIDRQIPETAPALLEFAAVLIHRGFSPRSVAAALDELADPGDVPAVRSD